ncbi:MAG: AAA-like domain-containing protein [Cyanobacteria bacterium P01_D01_bin.105]
MPTDDANADYLNLIDQLVHQKTGQSLTNIQQLVLSECLQPHKITYEAIAHKNNYSSSYIQQRVAPDLWYLMSEIIGKKVNKANCRSVLFGYLDNLSLPEAAQTVSQKNKRPQTVAQNTVSEKNLCSSTSADKTVLEFPTESVPIGSPFYIQRDPQETCCHQLIREPGALVRIKAPRQMGKTSLVNRIVNKAKDYPAIILNFQQTEQSILKDLDKLLRWICANITRTLKLPSALDDFWDEDIGSKMSCTIYLEEYILEEISTPVILVLEESSELFEQEAVTKEFFGMLRTWYEYTKHNETWKKLRLILVQSTETYVQLNVNQSPFNVGFEVALKPFDRAQVDTLAERNSISLTAQQSEQLMVLLGGHPYLVRLAFYYLASESIGWEALIVSASKDNGIFKHHLQRHLWQLQQHTALALALKEVLATSEPVKIAQDKGFKLHSMGLVRLDGHQVQISCELYRSYFSEYLIETKTAAAQ